MFSDIFLTFVLKKEYKNITSATNMNTKPTRIARTLATVGLLLSGLLLTLPISAQKNTRGIGIYPGAPEEFFGPQLVDSKEYRNVARGRMVYQSSAFDFNMTAQLLTDGIVEKSGTTPVFLEVTTPDGQLPWVDKKPLCRHQS